MKFSEVLSLILAAPLCLWLPNSFAWWQSKVIYLDCDHVAKGQDVLSALSPRPPFFSQTGRSVTKQLVPTLKIAA